jgi:hypothetical protein
VPRRVRELGAVVDETLRRQPLQHRAERQPDSHELRLRRYRQTRWMSGDSEGRSSNAIATLIKNKFRES